MTQVFIGSNSYQNIKLIIEENKFKKIFLVTNKNSFLTGGVSDYIFQSLVGCQYLRFNDFSVNPKFEDLKEGVKTYQEFAPDLIVGVGGGSAMDMAKLIHFMSESNSFTEDDFIEQMQTKSERNLKSKLMLIPTTSGSGSEATQFAVIYIKNKKHSLDHPSIIPDFSVIDGVFTKELPKNVTAYTGADALCQAIESYWSQSATKESKEYALKALKLLSSNLENAVKSPTLEIRNQMAEGSFYAGKAINITRTTAPHAFSYYLTTKYGYPHGQAVAITLPYFIDVNCEKIDLTQVFKVFNCSDSKSFKGKIIDLFSKIDLYIKLSDILKGNLEEFIESVNLERLKNNPVQLTKKEYMGLFADE